MIELAIALAIGVLLIACVLVLASAVFVCFAAVSDFLEQRRDTKREKR